MSVIVSDTFDILAQGTVADGPCRVYHHDPISKGMVERVLRNSDIINAVTRSEVADLINRDFSEVLGGYRLVAREQSEVAELKAKGGDDVLVALYTVEGQMTFHLIGLLRPIVGIISI